MYSAPISAGGNGINHVVPKANVPAGFAVRVLSFLLTYGGTVSATFQDTAPSPNVLAGPLYGVAGGGHPSPPPPLDERYLFQGAKGEGLDLSLSGAVAVGGFVVYDFAAA